MLNKNKTNQLTYWECQECKCSFSGHCDNKELSDHLWEHGIVETTSVFDHFKRKHNKKTTR